MNILLILDQIRLLKYNRVSDTNFKTFLSQSCNNSIFFKPTSVVEILDIVSSLKSSNACCYDEISNNLLKKIILNVVIPLSHIFNLSLQSGIVPCPLKIAKVIPVYKKDDSSLLGNYRPISILSNFSKILERIVYNRLYSFLNYNELLITCQYGFRKFHSTDFNSPC